MSPSKSLLFVGGNARSGTSELVRLLNAHPDVLIGMERYFRKISRNELSPELFGRDRFLDIRDEDTQPRRMAQFEDKPAFEARFDSARIIGDKFPAIATRYDRILAACPDARFLFIVRNPFSVAESYEARMQDKNDKWNRGYREAISEWNRSVRTTLRNIRDGKPITVVTFERLFGDPEAMKRVFSELGLDAGRVASAFYSATAKKYARKSGQPSERREDIRFEIAQTAAFDAYQKLVRDHCILNGMHKVEELEVGV